MSPTLSTAVSKNPYTEFHDWWPLGEPFVTMMAEAISCQWRPLAPSADSITSVQATVDEYISLVYQRQARPGLAAGFAAASDLGPIQSGEFDALSYAFFHSAYQTLASQCSRDELGPARRSFAERVGAHFFAQLTERLELHLPSMLQSESEFDLVKSAISRVGAFLLEQGYLRSYFSFRFDVSTSHAGLSIDQEPVDVLQTLASGGTAYALYEMGHPVILPSAVYLYQIVGEAQHHSSRTIEEMFSRVGCDAWETDDFDPSSFSSDLVVELWQIRRRQIKL